MPLIYCRTTLKLIHFSYMPLLINAVCSQNKMCSFSHSLCVSSLIWSAEPGGGCPLLVGVGNGWRGPPGFPSLSRSFQLLLPSFLPVKKLIQGTRAFSTTYFLCFSILKCLRESLLLCQNLTCLKIFSDTQFSGTCPSISLETVKAKPKCVASSLLVLTGHWSWDQVNIWIGALRVCVKRQRVKEN